MIGAHCLRMAQVPEACAGTGTGTIDTYSEEERRQRSTSLQSCNGSVWLVNPPCPFGLNSGSSLVSGYVHTV